MRRLILNIIESNWDRQIFVGTPMSTFFIDIYRYLILLNTVYVDDTHLIAIHGRRSRNWIALYLACWIANVNFIILSPSLERVKLLSILQFVNASYLFTQPYLINFCHNDMKNVPFLKGAYDMDNVEQISLRQSVYNQNLTLNLVNRLDPSLVTKRLLKEIKKMFGPSKTHDVMNLTPGITHHVNKIVVSTSESILSTVLNGIETLPFTSQHSIYSKVEFADSHVLSILIPFIKGCTFGEIRDEANVIIESRETFERMWYDTVDSILESKIIYWFFKKRAFSKLFEKYASESIKRHYGNMEYVIVHNGDIHERCLTTAKKALPLIVTYGSQETNQLVAVNDFSTPAYNVPGSVGRLFGTPHVTKKGELLLMSKGVFKKYLSDEAHTNYILGPDGSIRTSDHFTWKDDLLTYNGRMDAVYEKNGNIVHLDKIERHIRSLPCIEECVLLPWEDGLVHLNVKVNLRFVEAHKQGWNETTRILNSFYDSLRASFTNSMILGKAVISPVPLKKAFNGKVRTYLYRDPS